MSNRPATCVCCQVSPRSWDPANQASAVNAASPGRSLRRSYHVTPTVPCASTAIDGTNANALTPVTAVEVQVRPPSRGARNADAAGAHGGVPLGGDVDGAVRGDRRARESGLRVLVAVPLTGGHITRDVVRVGETVHRTRSTSASFAGSVLCFLETAGYAYAPRFLGIDEQGDCGDHAGDRVPASGPRSSWST
jgi:hypothetical protein